MDYEDIYAFELTQESWRTRTDIRRSVHMLPRQDTACPFEECPYNQQGVCDDPRTNRGNSDALCHKMPLARLFKALGLDDEQLGESWYQEIGHHETGIPWYYDKDGVHFYRVGGNHGAEEDWCLAKGRVDPEKKVVTILPNFGGRDAIEFCKRWFRDSPKAIENGWDQYAQMGGPVLGHNPSWTEDPKANPMQAPAYYKGKLGDSVQGFVSLFEARSVLRVDEHGKHIVWQRDPYYICVDDPDAATYITLWSQEVRGKIGYLSLTKGRYSETRDYMVIRDVEVDSSYRGERLGRALYAVALEYSSPATRGIASEAPDRSNKRQVPRIWASLGAVEGEDGTLFLDRS